mmetsp:Transcript_38654/g.65061  ORF Transcript_38654/g.65061 Transcript_38654/m.65061 type:complete len:728 (-) Transcript_38654:46-2229(-)
MCGFFLLAAKADGESDVRAEYEQGPAGLSEDVPPEFEKYVTRDKGTYIFGRLGAARRFWANALNASMFILSVITVGYQLPFRDGVAPRFDGFMMENSKGVTGPSKFGPREDFVDGAVASLLANGAVVECERSFLQLISPLNVIEQGDKLRLIHNLSFLNEHLCFDKFRFEDLRDVPQIFELGDWVFSIDLMSAYHHVPLHKDAWTYMGFSWKGRFYYFRVLPFGLGPAPMVFAKVTGVMVEHWRAQGAKILPYLDDFLGGSQTTAQAKLLAHLVLTDMTRAGWLVAATKVKLQMSQTIVHLGGELDFRIGQYRLPSKRISFYHEIVGKVLYGDGRVKVKVLAKIAGLAQSFRVALGPVVSFYTRHMYVAIESCTSWWQVIDISPEVTVELQKWFFMDFSKFWQPMWPSLVQWPAFRDVYSDAGDRGWGGCLLLPSGERLDARGYLTDCERKQSSTWRELMAIFRILESVGHLIPRGTRLQWHTDSQNAAWDMSKGGSSKLDLHTLCLQIFEFCVAAGISALWVWIPRKLNAWSDALAGLYDKDDWMLHPWVFAAIDRLWGKHTIDRFASDLNHVVELFNSYFWCPGTGGVNAFGQADWLFHNNWCNPPFWLIGRLIMFLREIGAAATIIVPCWPRQPWWRFVCPDGRHLADYILGALRLRAHRDLFMSGQHSGNTRGCKMPGYNFFALRVSFRTYEMHLRTHAYRCLCPRGCQCGGYRSIPEVDVLH